MDPEQANMWAPAEAPLQAWKQDPVALLEAEF